jgi:D-aspartate ligase
LNRILGNRESASGAPASDRSTPGAVVVGGDYQGLGIVRSLGRKGIPICVIDDEFSISRFSKYCTHFVKAASLREARDSVDALLKAVNRLDLSGWVLYPTREELVATFSNHREELGRFFRVPTPAWSSVQCAWDKRITYRKAAELGIPTPAICYPQNSGDLRKLEHVKPPFTIKPAIKEHFVYKTKAKAWRADTFAELTTLLQKAYAVVGSDGVIVQELIPGGGEQQFAYCAFFRDGNAVGSMTACRRRQHPMQFGKASTYVETVEVPVLEEYSARFLRAIDYYGLVEMEYKLDPRDHQYKLLDVNARTWGYHSLGPRAGVDFSYMLYADQVGVPVTPCRAKPGIGWVRMASDVPAAFTAMLTGDTDIRGYIRSMSNCNVEAVFSREDLWPGLMEILMIPYLAIKRGF